MLEAAVSLCESSAVYCGGVVFLGLIVEVIIAVMHPSYNSLWEQWGSVFADVLVASGVLGEILFSARSNTCQGELIRRSNVKLQEAHTIAILADGRASSARSSADSAHVELAKANARAAEANQKALEASLALEMFRAPRALSPEQQSRISNELKQFAGTTFDIASGNNKEQLKLVDKIEEAIIAAGWVANDWPAGIVISRVGKRNVGMAAETGVSVQVEMAHKDALLPIAKLLAEALTVEGIAARAEFVAIAQTNNPSAIHIVVGEKQ